MQIRRALSAIVNNRTSSFLNTASRDELRALSQSLSSTTRRRLCEEMLDSEVMESIMKQSATGHFAHADRNMNESLCYSEFEAWYKSRVPTLQPYSAAAAEIRDGPSEPLNKQQYRALVLRGFVPFVGFGILDNGIMIMAGNSIEHSLGMYMGISTLAAAGLGNLISDVAGISTGNLISSALERAGLPDPKLNTRQRQKMSTKAITLISSVFGISVGCLIGMFPLLFI